MWMRIFENKVLKILFGPKREDVMEDWRKLHNEEACSMYSSPNIIRVINSRSVTGWGT
jgi:hypothetical protein